MKLNEKLATIQTKFKSKNLDLTALANIISEVLKTFLKQSNHIYWNMELPLLLMKN